jgi:hypothetical protein
VWPTVSSDAEVRGHGEITRVDFSGGEYPEEISLVSGLTRAKIRPGCYSPPT